MSPYRSYAQSEVTGHPFDTDLVRPIRSGKTIYVRFDLNDYSIPPAMVGRTLTLVASTTTVRLLDGVTEVAFHRRSYDRHQLILDPTHQDALLQEKRKAFASTSGSRLSSGVGLGQAAIEIKVEIEKLREQVQNIQPRPFPALFPVV